MKVLVIDDSITLRTSFCKHLTLLGHNCFHAIDGMDAMRSINEHTSDPFQVVFLDINMPRMNGMTLLKQLRDGKFDFTKTKFILVTTETSKVLMQEAKELGAFAWIAKPACPDRLKEVMKKAEEQMAPEGSLTFLGQT